MATLKLKRGFETIDVRSILRGPSAARTDRKDRSAGADDAKVGSVANGGGNLNGNGYLTEGNPQGYQQLFTDLGAPDPGFVDAEGAEIHTVVRDRGPDTGNPEQTSTFAGDCTPGSSFGLGAGAFDCVDVQFSIHMA